MHKINSAGILFPNWTGEVVSGDQTFETMEAALAYAAAHPVAPTPEIAQPYCVLKDTIAMRIMKLGKVPAMRQFVKALDTDTQF